MWLAKIIVRLKPVVNDPPGLAIHGGLKNLGFDTVEKVRSGKYLEVTLDAPDADAAKDAVDRMCKTLLANPVIEDYGFTIERV